MSKSMSSPTKCRRSRCCAWSSTLTKVPPRLLQPFSQSRKCFPGVPAALHIDHIVLLPIVVVPLGGTRICHLPTRASITRLRSSGHHSGQVALVVGVVAFVAVARSGVASTTAVSSRRIMALESEDLLARRECQQKHHSTGVRGGPKHTPAVRAVRGSPAAYVDALT